MDPTVARPNGIERRQIPTECECTSEGMTQYASFRAYFSGTASLCSISAKLSPHGRKNPQAEITQRSKSRISTAGPIDEKRS